MARIVFQLDMDARPADVTQALASQTGIAGWWTDDVAFPGGVGSTMTLRFPIAPLPFELRVEETTADTVRWTSVGAFPPHWAHTTVTWTFEPAEDSGTTVHFSHDGWDTDDGGFATAAMTWAELMLGLKRFVETGTDAPLFRRA